MPSSGALVASAVFVTTSLVAVHASADDAEGERARCAASYESAQVLRRDEHLEAARTQLLICQSTCPQRLAGDCTSWLRDVESLTPTVRLVARDTGGQKIADALTTVDGRLVDARERAVAVEPGAHIFRFERRGTDAAEVRIELHAGERERVIAVVLSPSARPLQRESAPPAPRTASYVLGGVGVAGLVTAGILAIKGDVDRSSLRASCAPECDPARVDAVRTLWWTSAGVGAAGAIALGLAVVLWPRAHASALTITPRSVALVWQLR